jgi:pilus assembly protein Flp/PilA
MVMPTELQAVSSRRLLEFCFTLITLEKDFTMTGLMVSMLAFVAGVKGKLESDEKGATMVEYGIMVALIAVIVIVAVGPLGIAIQDMFEDVTLSL